MENKKIESEVVTSSSIFNKDKDKKRKGDFYKANETQGKFSSPLIPLVSEILKRKVVKRETEPAPNMIRLESTHEISMEVTDPQGLEKFTAFSVFPIKKILSHRPFRELSSGLSSKTRPTPSGYQSTYFYLFSLNQRTKLTLKIILS